MKRMAVNYNSLKLHSDVFGIRMIRQNEPSNQEDLSKIAALHLETEYEKQFRLITETIPMPIIICRVSDGIFVYANESAGSMFGLPVDSLVGRKPADFYDFADLRPLWDVLARQGYVSNFELQGKKADGAAFWSDMFIRSLKFNNEPCYLCVFYDMTQRILEEQEICKLREELEQLNRAREGKYLTFTLASVTYGINIKKVRRIIRMMPIRSVPRSPDFVKGVISLRGRIIPVMDLRLRFGVDAKDYTDRTCIIVVEMAGKNKGQDGVKNELGIVVDSVSEVLKVSNEDIEDAPKIGIGLNTNYILGMAMSDGGVKILVNTDRILSDEDISALDDVVFNF